MRAKQRGHDLQSGKNTRIVSARDLAKESTFFPAAGRPTLSTGKAFASSASFGVKVKLANLV